ncbi:unnamed protein product [Cuscuta campestris]|uniref:Uncharacterized protein n=1 Tax=Cuscuta campestris TaxID=132261 RepID=A0A484NB44_9ASTE|nr:unnamed protein product [Cuscuta campestris]
MTNNNMESIISQTSTPAEGVTLIPGGIISLPSLFSPMITTFTTQTAPGQALHNFGQIMPIFQQPGGFTLFIPGMYPHALGQNTNLPNTLEHPPSFQPVSTSRSVTLTNLAGELERAGPSRPRRSRSHKLHTQVIPDGNVRSVRSREEDSDIPKGQKKLQGKAVQPEDSRRSVFQRLGHEGRKQNRPAKERLGVKVPKPGKFYRREGGRRPGQTGRFDPHLCDEPQHSRVPRAKGQAENQPKVAMRRHVEPPSNRVDMEEERLERLLKRVRQEEKKKVVLNNHFIIR